MGKKLKNLSHYEKIDCDVTPCPICGNIPVCYYGSGIPQDIYIHIICPNQCKKYECFVEGYGFSKIAFDNLKIKAIDEWNKKCQPK